MAGSFVYPVSGTADLSRIEAPVTFKAYLLCAFAAFGGICECAMLGGHIHGYADRLQSLDTIPAGCLAC
jgi:hypothetical protein